MWHNCAHTLACLPKLCSNRFKFKWTDLEQNAFTKMNKIVGIDVIIVYHNCSKELMIYTHDSKTHLGEVISKNEIPFNFTHVI